MGTPEGACKERISDIWQAEKVRPVQGIMKGPLRVQAVFQDSCLPCGSSEPRANSVMWHVHNMFFHDCWGSEERGCRILQYRIINGKMLPSSEPHIPALLAMRCDRSSNSY
ncbi:uncharacterized protein LOC144235837 [Crocuta crocuta]